MREAKLAIASLEDLIFQSVLNVQNKETEIAQKLKKLKTDMIKRDILALNKNCETHLSLMGKV